jgi:hypothetical protein
MRLIAQATQARAISTPEDPLICLQDTEDGLTLVEGDDPIAVVRDLAEHERNLQDTLVFAPA